MRDLPDIMVAPNGARLGKDSHGELPLSLSEIVLTGRDCFIAGAGGMHAHVRDIAYNHVLDAGLYRELIDEMALVVPEMLVQITTESVGMYCASEQRQLVMDVVPCAASFSLSEMFSDGDESASYRFYHWACESSIAIQHIIYSGDELLRFVEFERGGMFGSGVHQLLFVLGRYSVDRQSKPEQLYPFLEILGRSAIECDWAACAFGVAENACAEIAFKEGGKFRVGFENSLTNGDGSIALDNAERVREIASIRARTLVESHD